MKSEYLKARTAGMTASEKRKYLKFDSLCKQASKCRESRRQISCYSCPLFDSCNIQQEMKKVQT